jgi:DNA-directed RNA polymerase specialized sigma24 family protein
MVADGMSYREMSAATGLGEGAIRVRVHRCRQRALAIRLRLLAGEAP